MDKRVVLISLLVIVGAVSISGCLGPDEEQTYNEQMTIVYDDISELNEDTQKIMNYSYTNNTELDEVISVWTKVVKVCDNDTKILTELNDSISNDTRKEYIKLCIDELQYSIDAGNLLIERAETFKKYNSKNITISELSNKISTLDKKLNNLTISRNDTSKKADEYEKKYPFVLINGTKSLNKAIMEE